MKMKHLQWVAGLMLLTLLAACGSNRNSDGPSVTSPELGTDPTTGNRYAGSAACIDCHESFSWSSKEVSAYLDGIHVVNHATSYGYDYMLENGCAECHDPIGDSATLSEIKGEDVVAMGCENCHGAGGEHYGVGPIPTPTPGPEACGSCHSTLPENHLTYHPEADTILEEYLSSPHAASINDHTYVEGSDSDVRARCSKCHTDEGGKLFVSIQGDSDTMHALDGNPAISDASPVQCRTCHNPHSPTELLLEDLEDSSGTVTASAEYRTCTNCHQSATAYHDPATNPYGALGEIITDTHFDNGKGTGYNIDPASERACRDCHNVHSADNSINNQWAASGHGDLTAAFTDAHGAPTNTACQDCHSATAATMLFEAYESGEDYTAPGSEISGPAPEVIYCTVCHKDNAGNLRAPGAITTHYHAVDSDDYAVIDGVNGSNLCLACHAGKRSGEDIKDGINAITSRVSSHYLPAGGVLFGQIGYHFDHLDASLAYTATKHAQLGDPNYDWADYPYKTLSAEQTGAIQGSGNGPCVACHMAEGTDSHLYSAFTDNTDLGLPDLCYNCHSNDPAAGHYFKSKEKLETETKVGYLAALSAIEGMMADPTQNYTSGVLSIGSSGQFQRDGLNLDPTVTADVDLAGALFNYKLFLDEHGGYVHNRYYAKQLLFDSIDYLQNGSITGNITVNDATAAAWLDGDSDTAGIQRK
ncbi:MAG: hypothetical protein C0621_03285 [Desulfuromonas sp.]|nr:MAG: hypothetical protein C0621_03285 [Desulfuromonas sp.]